MTERTRDHGLLSPSLRSRIGAFVAMDLMRDASARQAAGEDIIHMEVGQPGTPAPRLARDAAASAIAAGKL
ncbi:MAG: pyridoxal phosphate-dependent aminotransferase, partial [Rhodomicrobium sp.]